MSNIRQEMLETSIAHFQGNIKKHVMNVELLLRNPVGVAEHSDVMDTIEKELAIIAEYDDKLEIIHKYFNNAV